MATLDNDLPKAEPIFKEDNLKKRQMKNGIICCWNVEAKGDIYSKWCRSITFKDVYRFYKNLRNRATKWKK